MRAEEAAEAFRKLFEEQAARAERIGKEEPRDWSARPLNIGLIPGDGIGPMIMQVAEAVLRHLLRDEMEAGRICLLPIEGLTLQRRLERQESVPRDVLEQIRSCPVLLKGPTTTPGGGTMTSANVTLRRELDLYANVRPVQVMEEGIDWTFFRENTEGEYTLGSLGVEGDGLAFDFRVITVPGCRRIARSAFEYARKTGKHRVTLVTKANILKKTDGMFSRVCREVAGEYPDIQTDEYYVDIMAANLVNPAVRSGFQVILTPNLYGDILTDEAAQIQGGVGTAGSANLGDRYAMFEAIHGSAPRLMEQGLGEYASPESILMASVMLLEHIGLASLGARLREALRKVREAGLYADGTKNGMTGHAFGQAVMARL